MLVRHCIAHHERPDLGQAFAQTDTRLQRLLAQMKSFVGYCVHGSHPIHGIQANDAADEAASPTGVRSIGTKPGSASTRSSHAHSGGYGSSDTLPSGAQAT